MATGPEKAASARANAIAVTATDSAASPPTCTIPVGAATARAPGSAGLLVDDGLSEGDGDCMRTGIRLQLREDMPYVALDGLLADEELRGHVGVRHPVGQELQDLALARGQHVLA